MPLTADNWTIRERERRRGLKYRILGARAGSERAYRQEIRSLIQQDILKIREKEEKKKSSTRRGLPYLVSRKKKLEVWIYINSTYHVDPRKDWPTTWVI